MIQIKHAISYVLTEKVDKNFVPNIFDDPAQIKAIGVNCEGIMGAGQALEAQKRYPKLFEKYEQACKAGQLKEGGDCKWLANPETKRGFLLAATKKQWRQASRMQYLEAICKNICDTITKHKITSIALPILGCGLGGLNWDEVGPMMAFYLDPLPDVQVRIYLPRGMKEYFAEDDLFTSPMNKLIDMVMLDLRNLYHFGHSPRIKGIIEKRHATYMQEHGVPMQNYYQALYVTYFDTIFEEQRRVRAIELILTLDILPLDTPYLRAALEEARATLRAFNEGLLEH